MTFNLEKKLLQLQECYLNLKFISFIDVFISTFLFQVTNLLLHKSQFHIKDKK